MDTNLDAVILEVESMWLILDMPSLTLYFLLKGTYICKRVKKSTDHHNHNKIKTKTKRKIHYHRFLNIFILIKLNLCWVFLNIILSQARVPQLLASLPNSKSNKQYSFVPQPWTTANVLISMGGEKDKQ